MTDFHQKNFQDRWAKMGDPAEQAFEAVCNAQGRRFMRFGWDRWPGSMNRMSVTLRYTPDYALNGPLVECMGIGGRNPSLKIKDEKVRALWHWDTHIQMTDLFVFDQPRNMYCKANIHEWITALDRAGIPRQFPEGKKYRELQREDFPSAFRPVPPLPADE